ncbi:MAG: hypothetical protein PHH14_00470 [Candidatus Margulisbacteria bacterium]|nr:hypothetical protein [Candidatus Margulisiibacteriota bacterium]
MNGAKRIANDYLHSTRQAWPKAAIPEKEVGTTFGPVAFIFSPPYISALGSLPDGTEEEQLELKAAFTEAYLSASAATNVFCLGDYASQTGEQLFPGLAEWLPFYDFHIEPLLRSPSLQQILAREWEDEQQISNFRSAIKELFDPDRPEMNNDYRLWLIGSIDWWRGSPRVETDKWLLSPIGELLENKYLRPGRKVKPACLDNLGKLSHNVKTRRIRVNVVQQLLSFSVSASMFCSEQELAANVLNDIKRLALDTYLLLERLYWNDLLAGFGEK